MTRPKRRIAVAVRGAGPAWSSRWAVAAEGFAERMRVAAVSDAVAARRDAAAEKAGAFAAAGLETLTSIASLDGVIVCDGGGAGAIAASRLAGRIGAVLLAEPPWGDFAAADRLTDLFHGRGEVLVATTARFTPAVQRLKELIATRLGPPGAVAIARGRPAAEAVDLARYLAGDAFDAGVVRLGADGGVRWGVGDEAPPPDPRASIGVAGRSGRGDAFDDVSVRWRTEGREETERLETDRSAEAVVLDLFLRRAAGGLIPMPTRHDLAAAVEIARGIGPATM